MGKRKEIVKWGRIWKRHVLIPSGQLNFFDLIFMFGAWKSKILEHGALLQKGVGSESTPWDRYSERCGVLQLEKYIILILKQKVPQMKRPAWGQNILASWYLDKNMIKM